MSPPLKESNKDGLPIRPLVGPDGRPLLNDPTDVPEPNIIGQVISPDDGRGPHRDEEL